MSDASPVGSSTNKVIAIARKLAIVHAHGQAAGIGPEYLAAGLLKAMGSAAAPILLEHGISSLAASVERIPDADAREMGNLPPVRPNHALASLLIGRLKPFLEGSSDQVTALRVLLEDQALVDGLKALLVRVHGQRSVQTPVSETLRALTRNLQKGYLIGRTYYLPTTKKPVPDYASEADNGAFANAAREFELERDAIRSSIYSGPRSQRYCSFERYMREMGPVAADVAMAVMINALTPFTESGGPISVRDVAWSLDPRQYHMRIGSIVDAVKVLRRRDLVRILPEEDHCQLFSGLLPSEPFMAEFNGYVGDSYKSSEESVWS